MIGVVTYAALGIDEQFTVKNFLRGPRAQLELNDGNMEAVVENLVGQPMILRPEGGLQNIWVSFQLEGHATQQTSALPSTG